MVSTLLLLLHEGTADRVLPLVVGILILSLAALAMLIALWEVGMRRRTWSGLKTMFGALLGVAVGSNLLWLGLAGQPSVIVAGASLGLLLVSFFGTLIVTVVEHKRRSI